MNEVDKFIFIGIPCILLIGWLIFIFISFIEMFAHSRRKRKMLKEFHKQYRFVPFDHWG